MHKIDREQLKEALEALKGDVSDWERFQEKHGLSPHSLRKQAAENWLEISDPDYKINPGATLEIFNLKDSLERSNYKLKQGDWNLEYAIGAFKIIIAKAGQ